MQLLLLWVTNRSHRHPVLSQHPGWRMLPAVRCPTLHLYRLDYLDFAALVPVPAAALTPALSGLGPTSAQDGQRVFV